MSAERAYLIVSQTAHHGKRTRTRTRAAWSDRAAANRRPRTASHGPVRPRSGQPLSDPTGVEVAGFAAFVRRRGRPGRHRLGTPGLRPYRAGRRDVGALARPRARLRRPAHCARHAVPARRSFGLRDLPRGATLVVVLATLLISGWFAASGAAAFAQMVQP